MKKRLNTIAVLEKLNNRMTPLQNAITIARTGRAIPGAGQVLYVSEKIALYTLYQIKWEQELRLTKENIPSPSCAKTKYSESISICLLPSPLLLRRRPTPFPDVPGTLELNSIPVQKINCRFIGKSTPQTSLISYDQKNYQYL